MSKLSYGLKITGKKTQQQSSVSGKKPRLSAFGDDSDSEDDQHAIGTNIPPIGLSKETKKGSSGKSATIRSVPAAKGAENSDELDPSIYDYDAAWEDIKQVERKKKESNTAEMLERKPKYMESLLAAAEVRKRDQLRAKERILQKEREEEGEEFADKEKFVTGAYREQQAEMQRLEEEERLKEGKLAKGSQGMSSFYRNMLDKTEERHADLVSATTTSTSHQDKNDRPEKSNTEKQKSEIDLANEINAKHAGAIAVNDEGQVIDKRQLLSAGLNVVAKKKDVSKAENTRFSNPQRSQKQPLAHKMASRERQTQVIAQQLEDARKREVEEEQESLAEVKRQAKMRKTTGGDVQSARERYLKRKAEMANK